MNILNKIFKKKMSAEQQAIIQLSEGLRILENHLVAIARLQFIKPESLVRESDNIEKNLEYLKKLLELRNKNESNS